MLGQIFVGSAINFLWIYSFLHKNLFTFVSPTLKLHNQYCQNDSNLSANSVAIAGSNPGQSSNVTDAGHGRNGASKNHQDKSLSKKTNSTDNIIDFVTTSTNTVADPRSTEVRIYFYLVHYVSTTNPEFWIYHFFVYVFCN